MGAGGDEVRRARVVGFVGAEGEEGEGEVEKGEG